MNFDIIFFESYQAINSFIIANLDIFFTEVFNKKKTAHFRCNFREKFVMINIFDGCFKNKPIWPYYGPDIYQNDKNYLKKCLF